MNILQIKRELIHATGEQLRAATGTDIHNAILCHAEAKAAYAECLAETIAVARKPSPAPTRVMRQAGNIFF